MKKNIIYMLLFYILTSGFVIGQIKPDLQNKSSWTLIGRDIEMLNEAGKKGVKFDEKSGQGLWVLNDLDFAEGVIELDIKGRNKLQQSFVGLASHYQNDSTYTAIYFRPFNFSNPDTARRIRALQYICMPKYDWPKLRADHPGVYENKVSPVPNPDDWFHAKIIYENNKISVFVDHAATASLTVFRLDNTISGKIGLWVGNGSDGSFANLSITKK